MRIVVDGVLFEDLQMKLKNRLGKAIFGLLDETDFKPAVVDRLCDEILADIAAQIDGEWDPIIHNGIEYSPFLVFVSEDEEAQNEDESETLIVGTGSSMHEHVAGTSEAIRNGAVLFEDDHNQEDAEQIAARDRAKRGA